MARISFTEHPAEVGETYLGHLMAASGFGLRLLVTAGACLVHAICPWLCTHTARDRVLALHDELQSRSKQPAPARRSTMAGLAAGAD